MHEQLSDQQPSEGKDLIPARHTISSQGIGAAGLIFEGKPPNSLWESVFLTNTGVPRSSETASPQAPTVAYA